MAGTIIEFLLVLIAHAVVGIYSSTLKYSKKFTFIIWGIWVSIQSGLMFYAEIMTTNPILQFVFGYVIVFIGQYTIFFITTKGKLAQRVFTLTTYSIFFSIAMALFTMVKGTFPEANHILIAVVNVAMLGAGVYYFLCHICPLCRHAARNITNGWAQMIVVNAILFMTVILASVFPVRIASFSDPTVLSFFSLVIAIMAVYPVIFSNINNMSEVAIKREVEKQNKLLLAQIEVEDVQLAAESHARHDRRHHNQVMLELVNMGDIERLREYLKSLVREHSDVNIDESYCENVTVNTVLTVYARRAKENGINLKISAIVSKDADILPQDIVIVIANLFENAVNATSKLKNNHRLIEISIKENARRLFVKVDNPCKSSMTFDETKYGVGIHSVIATVNKYDGMCDFTANNGVFSAKISMNKK